MIKIRRYHSNVQRWEETCIPEIQQFVPTPHDYNGLIDIKKRREWFDQLTQEKAIKNGIIKYVRVKEEDQPEEAVDHKDLEIKRLEAIVQLLEDRIKQLEANKSSEPQEIEAAPIESYAMYC